MKRVAILRGGPSSEYDVSMLSGAAVLEALTTSKYGCSDIVISKTGQWLKAGKKVTPAQALVGIDVVFTALHGTYGEDGQLQRILEQFGVPYTGSNGMASSLAFNKHLTKQHLEQHGIKTPKSLLIKKHELRDARTITKIESTLGEEFFAKPPASGSSDGARRILAGESTYDALSELFSSYDQLLLEEFISGTEATVGVIESFRDQDAYALPVVEIIPPQEATFFDRTVKYSGQTQEIVPGNFSNAIRDELQRLALLAHKELGCSQYSRSDFLVRGDEIFFLETNTLPGLTSESLFPKAAAAVGLEFKDLIAHLIESAKV